MTIAGLVLAASLLAASAASAFPGVPRPGLSLSAGRTFAVTDAPDGGGASCALAALWPVHERARFGVTAFADDIGTTLAELHDPNNGTPLGTVAELHRWAWGAAWCADVDVLASGKWTAGASGAWGYWRVEDDQRGSNIAAASSLGFTLGCDLRRALGRNGGRDVGIAVRYHRLNEDDSAAWRRVDRYASAALELRWAAPGGND